MGKVQDVRKWCGVLAATMAVLVLVCFWDALALVSQAATGKANSNAKIRKEASTNSTAVGSVTKGATVEITGETKASDGKVWYSVNVNGTTGYIRSDLIDKTDDAAGGTGTATTNPTTDGIEQLNPVSATISGGNTVRVRTSASTENSNNILTTAANGTKVTVVARTTGTDKKLWYQVKLTVNGKEVIGYVRNDYLTIDGEVTPLTEETVTPPDDTTTQPDTTTPTDTPKNTETTTPAKRYETRLMNEKWYLLDYEENRQYDLDEIFTATKDFEDKYLKEQSKNKGLMTWVVILAILAIAGCGAAAYFFYRNRELMAEYMKKIENNTPKRTSERPERLQSNAKSGSQQAGRDKPAIRDGLEPRREERGVQNGQRQTGNRAQQNAQRQGNGQEGAQMQNGRPSNGTNSQNMQRGAMQPQGSQRQSSGQQQRMTGNQAQQGVTRSSGAQPQQTAQRPQGAQPQNKAKNFVQEDEREFEFLNWDSDE